MYTLGQKSSTCRQNHVNVNITDAYVDMPHTYVDMTHAHVDMTHIHVYTRVYLHMHIRTHVCIRVYLCSDALAQVCARVCNMLGSLNFWPHMSFSFSPF